MYHNEDRKDIIPIPIFCLLITAGMQFAFKENTKLSFSAKATTDSVTIKITNNTTDFYELKHIQIHEWTTSATVKIDPKKESQTSYCFDTIFPTRQKKIKVTLSFDINNEKKKSFSKDILNPHFENKVY